MQTEFIHRLLTLLCFLAWENRRLHGQLARLRRELIIARRCSAAVQVGGETNATSIS